MGHRVKALIEIEGRTVLDRILDVVAPRFAALAIAANDPSPYAGCGFPVLPDAVLGQGPLAGILSALRWCRRPYLLAVPCDMPFLDGRIVDLLLSRREPGVAAVAPFVRGLPEPLLALYGQTCLPALERRLDSGQYKASGLLTDEGLKVSPIYEAELRAIDPELTSLTNLNSHADLRRLEAEISQRPGPDPAR